MHKNKRRKHRLPSDQVLSLDLADFQHPQAGPSSVLALIDLPNPEPLPSPLHIASPAAPIAHNAAPMVPPPYWPVPQPPPARPHPNPPLPTAIKPRSVTTTEGFMDVGAFSDILIASDKQAELMTEP